MTFRPQYFKKKNNTSLQFLGATINLTPSVHLLDSYAILAPVKDIFSLQCVLICSQITCFFKDYFYLKLIDLEFRKTTLGDFESHLIVHE